MCIVWCLRPRLCCQSRSSSTVLRSSSSSVSALNGIFDSICAEVLICGDSIKICVCVLAVGEHVTARRSTGAASALCVVFNCICAVFLQLSSHVLAVGEHGAARRSTAATSASCVVFDHICAFSFS